MISFYIVTIKINLYLFTSRPTNFDSEYFQNLLNYKWKLIEGRGGKNQWEPVSGPDGSLPMAPSAHGKGWEKVGMLTTDIALCTDPDYNEIVKLFAKDEEKFLSMFAHAWYKLTTRDMGPRSRCINTDTAPASQDWQNGLPDRTESPPDFTEVRQRIVSILDSDNAAYGQFARLAWQCASSFRVTDYQGGCNGARLRSEILK